MSVLLIVREKQHRESLVNIGLEIARAKNIQLYVLQISDGKVGSGLPEITWDGSAGMQNCHVKSINSERTIKDAVTSVKSDLLIIHDASDHSATQKRVVNDLMQNVACEVMVIRMGERNIEADIGKILVPCSGGRHSRVALRLADKLSPSNSTALYVEPDVDEVSESVGFAHLHRYVNRAGISLDTMRCHVELDDNPFIGIRREAEAGNYGLMIIGASGHSSVRKKLFGTLPEKLMKGDQGMSVAVVRAARPMKDRFMNKIERLLHLNVPQLKRDERVALFDEVGEKSKWSFDFAALMILATSIAGLGLLADSGAVVIGAMLVAPLMMPLLGGGLSLVQGNWPLWRNCQTAVLLGFLSALSIGVILGLIARALSMQLTSQLLARGEPSTLDLGVAFLSGIAASYCLARPKLSSALAGVAIAAALVPPIATTGICLALGQFTVAQGAALLFGTNVVAIVIGAAVNFYMAGIRGKQRAHGVWSQRFFIIFALLMAGLLVPLSSALISRIAGPEQVKIALKEEATLHEIKIKKVLRGSYIDGVQELEILLESPRPLTDQTMRALKLRAEKVTGKKIKLKIRTLLVGEM